ncbi:hypothetical protein SPSYN_02021 [Sporotomaculum syntrophicum]|uniref:Uncharacterized protein n=1 Tax=Sporotomaculum syntrophicum TaxID=182264 RepID=A0A9D3AXW2_9FIRM|nr:hypothetical protein [Sporotomaculum syntrophicum]KAF1084851.1 hypothetical protein SPSYN_02021 [Sporotomaculum syntrophicum]
MNYIKIQLPKHILVLTAQEIEHLLAKDPELWARAIGRGKGVLRYERMKAREEAGETTKV